MSERVLFVIAISVVVALFVHALVGALAGGRSRRRVRERIHSLSADHLETPTVSLVRLQYLEQLSPLERKLESLPALEPLIRQLARAGVAQPAYRFLLLAAGSALAGLVLGRLFTGAPLFSVIGAGIGAVAPFAWLNHRKQQRLATFEEQLPDGLSILARTLRAGLPFTQAIQVVSEELEGPLAQEFGIVFTELNYGGEMRTALIGMMDRIPSMSLMALATSILIQRETGGNLAEVVDNIERLLRARFRFLRSLKTLTAANRLSALIVMAMPFGLAGVLELNQPGYLSTLIDDPVGRKLLYGAIVMQILGALWIRRMVKIDI